MIATLEWPPYICSACAKNGAAADALRSLLKDQGITVEFVFFPWVQAQKNGAKPKYVGYFPAWREEVLPEFNSSKALFSSPVVFLQRKEAPLKWQNLHDLRGKTFAVTQGYGNTQEFNRHVKDGTFKILTVLSDEITLKRLAEGTVDGVLMDYKVAQHYLKALPQTLTKSIEINPKIVEIKELYFAFNKYSPGQLKILNALIESANFSKSVDTFLLQGP
ncbi:MAG: transporter substrate-binding domain-containing protein [Bdellovibrio sp.]|nr:transporter substrate-binding domain-containing protein [Bdellovibrio sp.]